MLFHANLQRPISRGNNMREFEDFKHFFSIIEENFEEFGNVFGKKSKFYEILCQEPIFSAIFCFFYDFMPNGTPEKYTHTRTHACTNPHVYI